MRLCMEARTMKALIPLLLVSTSALAVTTVQYAQRASAERKRADEIFAVSQKHEARIRELEKERGALDRELVEAQRPAVAAVPTPSIAPGSHAVSALQRVGPPPGLPLVAAGIVRAEAIPGGRAAFGLSP